MTVRGWSSVQVIWWAVRAARQARRHLDLRGLETLVVLPPPAAPSGCRRWVVAVLRIGRKTCLVRAALLQTWDAAHGRPRDLVIGVTAPGPGFKAHAWLDGEPEAMSAGYSEISRRSPPAVTLGGGDQAGASSGDGGHQPVEQAGKVGPRS